MNNGYIKLHRSITEWEWYDDPVTLKVFIHLLLTANHEDKKWHGKVIKRGQLVTSVAKLAEATKLSPKRVRTSLDRLVQTGEISKEWASKYTVINVENYSKFQCRDDDKGKQRASKGQAKGKQRATNKNINNSNRILEKNDKNEKKIMNSTKNNYALRAELPEELREPVDAFIEMRKAIRAPMTDRAIDMMIRKLHKLSGGKVETAKAILDQSTMNSWKGIYALKTEEKRNEVLELIKGGAFDE